MLTPTAEKSESSIPALFREDTTWWSLFLIVFFAVAAALLSTDGTPDFKIYHYYDGFAALHDRSALDVFPAQLQTALFSGLDVVYYSVFRALNDWPRLLNITLSIPYSGAALALFFIARLVIPADFRARNFLCAALALFGLTGAASLPTLATTMSDIVPGVPILFALAIWLSLENCGGHSIWNTVGVGLLAGLSVSVKLTFVPLFVGFFAAIAVRRILGVKLALWQAFAFGLTGLILYFAVDGHYLLSNYQRYGNPILPMMNNVFKSDLVDHGAWTDTRFMPKSVVMAIFYPAYWALRDSHDAIELNMRDPRLLIGVLSATTLVCRHMIRRVRAGLAIRGTRLEVFGFCIGVVYLVSYAIWEKLWSIYRYLAIQESLSGVMLMIALLTIFAKRVKALWIWIVLAAITVPTMWATDYPWWSRARRGPQAISVKLPAIEPNATVLFLDPYAYSYLVPSFPQTVRAIGANSNLVRPGSWGKLQEEIERTVRGDRGPLWGMEYPEAFPGVADSTLSYYHLVRDRECVLIDSNIEERPLVHLCRLKRQP